MTALPSSSVSSSNPPVSLPPLLAIILLSSPACRALSPRCALAAATTLGPRAPSDAPRDASAMHRICRVPEASRNHDSGISSSLNPLRESERSRLFAFSVGQQQGPLSVYRYSSLAHRSLISLARNLCRELIPNLRKYLLRRAKELACRQLLNLAKEEEKKGGIKFIARYY